MSSKRKSNFVWFFVGQGPLLIMTSRNPVGSGRGFGVLTRSMFSSLKEFYSFGEVTLNLHTGRYIGADAPLLRGLACIFETTGRQSSAWAYRVAT